MRRSIAGTVVVSGTALRGQDPRRAIELGVAHVPEDRLGTGVAPSLTIADNLILKDYRREPVSSRGFLHADRVRARADDVIQRYDIKAATAQTPTRLLSGGNVQRVLLARELSGSPKVLVAASPTRGLDIAATEAVRSLLLQAAARGVGILLISEDLDEILALADRIAVLYEGRVMGVVPRQEADVEELGLLMAGSTR
jgi:general nucleoside transport system ATP-binding protein